MTLSLTFSNTGHDTTASAISWILFSLSENPEYQVECQKEIDQVISDSEDGELGWYVLHLVSHLNLFTNNIILINHRLQK